MFTLELKYSEWPDTYKLVTDTVCQIWRGDSFGWIPPINKLFLRALWHSAADFSPHFIIRAEGFSMIIITLLRTFFRPSNDAITRKEKGAQSFRVRFPVSSVVFPSHFQPPTRYVPLHHFSQQCQFIHSKSQLSVRQHGKHAQWLTLNFTHLVSSHRRANQTTNK